MMEESASMSGEMGSYKVLAGETYMMIAFKIYGDYGKWKEIKNLNPNISGTLREGIELKYMAPSTPFAWNPQGDPYLIKNGDTLGTISTSVYGLKKRWKEIYDNNRPLIKDPNLIFAGFTLYYIPDRSMALGVITIK